MCAGRFAGVTAYRRNGATALRRRRAFRALLFFPAGANSECRFSKLRGSGVLLRRLAFPVRLRTDDSLENERPLRPASGVVAM